MTFYISHVNEIIFRENSFRGSSRPVLQHYKERGVEFVSEAASFLGNEMLFIFQTPHLG